MIKYLLRKRQSLQDTEQDSSTSSLQKKTFFLCCPHCQFSQEVLFSGISTFCKSCHKVINIEKVLQPQLIQDAGRPALKQAHCSHCNHIQLIPTNALSSFCKKCGKRINLQNYKIGSKFNGPIETQGIVHVSPAGELHSNVVCHSAIIEGKVNGTIHAYHKVELCQTATMHGSIEASHLLVQEGATFHGNGRITRNQN